MDDEITGVTSERAGRERPRPEDLDLGLDRAALEKLRLDCGEEFECVYEVFSAELRSILRDVGNSVRGEDYAGLRHAAEALRGSAATFALHGLREAAIGVETACRLGEAAHARNLAGELEALAEHALRVLDHEVSRH